MRRSTTGAATGLGAPDPPERNWTELRPDRVFFLRVELHEHAGWEIPDE